MYKDRFTLPNITFIFFDDQDSRVLASIHMEYASLIGAPFISLAGDCFHTTNLLPNLLTKYAHYDICCVTSQRVCPQTLNAVQAREQEIPYEDIFTPRELLKLTLPNLYYTEKRYFMDSYRAMGCYNGFFYPVRKNGVLIGELMRAFHWGVIYVKNPRTGLEQHNSSYWGLDSNPFTNELTTPETTGMITDSDDGLCVDIMSDGNPNSSDSSPILTNTEDIVNYWQAYNNGRGISEANESLMGYNVAIHSEPLDQSWIDLANQADEHIATTYGGAIKNKPLDWRMLP
jgi:hypothetical protein